MRLSQVMLMAWLLPVQGLACECATETIDDSYKSGAVVVAAEAISVSNGPSEGAAGRIQTVEWMVLESWKGSYRKGQRFKTQTHVQCCTCAASFAERSAFILSLAGSEPFAARACGGARDLKYAISEIPELYRLRAAAQPRRP